MTRLSRRSILQVLLVAGSLPATSSFLPREACAGQGEAPAVHVRWRVPQAHVDSVREQLRFRGDLAGDQTSVDSRGIPFFYILAGAVLVPYLADALIAVYRDVRYGGLLVQARGGEIVIENDLRLPGGTLLVKSADGIEVYQSARADPGKLIEALGGLTGKP